MNMRGAGKFMGMLFVVSLLSMLSMACHHDKRPKGILSQGEMVKVLSDVYINEQKLSRISLRPDSASLVFDKMKGKVLTHAGTADSVFKRSLDYYVERPKELELIYAALVDSLSLQEQRMDAKAANSQKAK